MFYVLKSEYIWDLVFTHFPRIIKNVFLKNQGLSQKYVKKNDIYSVKFLEK